MIMKASEKKFQDYLKVWKSSASILVWLLVPFHVGDSSSSRIKIMIKDYTLDTKDPHLRVVFEQLWECLSEWGDAGVGSSLKISSQKAFFKVLAFCLTFLFAPAKLRMILSWKEAPPSTLHHYSSSTSLLNWSSTKSLKISSSPFPQASQQALPPRLSPSLKRTFCILYMPIVRFPNCHECQKQVGWVTCLCKPIYYLCKFYLCLTLRSYNHISAPVDNSSNFFWKSWNSTQYIFFHIITELGHI